MVESVPNNPRRHDGTGSSGNPREKDIRIPLTGNQVPNSFQNELPVGDRPNKRRRQISEDLDPELAGEIVANSMLAREVDEERETELKTTLGVTSSDLEKEADRWLREAGNDDLVDGKDN